MKNTLTPSNLQEEYRQLAFNTLDAQIAIIDRAGNIVDVNESWILFASENGITDSQGAAVNLDYLEFLQRSQIGENKTAGEILQGIMGVLDGSRPSYTSEYPCDSSLTPCWINMKAKPLPPAQGGAVIIHENITARKRSEIALQESEEKFHRMFEKHAAIMLLIEPNTGTIMDANPAAEKFYGYSCEQLRWMKIGQINVPQPEAVTGRRTQAARKSPSPYIFFHRLASGEVRLVEVHSSPVQVNGSILLFSIIHDVSARVRAEEKLRESEEQLRIIYNTSPDAIGLFDAHANIVMMNPAAARIFGYSNSSEMLGKNALEFFIPEDRERAARVIARVFSEGMVCNVEFELLRKDGSHFAAEFNCSALYGADSKPDGILAVTRDITERKQVEAELKNRLGELNRWYKATLGREGRIIELKREINELLKRSGQPARYPQMEVE